MSRVLVLGLDGATYSVLDPLMQQGVMPFLAKFTAAGVRADLRSTPCPVTPPAWTSIMTGRSPGHHGIFDFIRVQPRESDHIPFHLTNARDIQCETLWSIVGRQGKASGILNFPNTYLARPFPGRMVPGFVTERMLGLSVHPREFWDRIKQMPAVDTRAVAWDLDDNRKTVLNARMDPDEILELVDALRRKEQGWHAITRDLIDEGSCDLVAVVFEGVDRLQHHTWDLLDPAYYPEDPTPEQAASREACLSYFRDLDEHMRDLVEAAGEDALVMIVSDHGFGATTEIFYANTWLAEQGYLRWKETSTESDEGHLSAEDMHEHFDSIDWDHTVAYARTTTANGIYLCLADDPGRPGVAPDHYETLRGEISEKLLALRNPETGEPVVVNVVTREEAFPGPAMPEAPDLTVTLRDDGFISILRSPVVWKRRQDIKGTHAPLGVFIAGGGGVAGHRELPELSVLDIAPTALYALGLEVPRDLEGRAQTELFAREGAPSRPVAYGEPTVSPDVEEERAPLGECSDDDQNAVLERLKALGYME